MRVVVEGLGLTTECGKELTLSLLPRLANHGSHQLVALFSNLPDYRAISGSNLRLILFPKTQSLLERYWILNRTVPGICTRERAEVLLCLGNCAPRRPPCPTVVLLQNAWLTYREPVAAGRLTVREKLIIAYGRHALRRLTPEVRVVVQTQVMRQRFLSLYKHDPNKVSVVPNSLFHAGETDSKLLPRRTPPARAFTFLCLARYYAHKNPEILVEALKLLPAYTSSPFQCFITISAQQHPGAQKLLRRISRENLENLIVNIGPVPRNKLAEVYCAADAFILPTLLETFSCTYDEAMHFGLPILTSDRDFARHRCRDAAIYFDPLDADSVARSMAKIMENAELRCQLVAAGKRILKQSTTWDEIATYFLSILERTARGWQAERGACWQAPLANQTGG